MDRQGRSASAVSERERAAEFRVESSKPAWGAIWPKPGARAATFNDRSLAVAVAAKATTEGAIQVVHVSSGEVVFRKENRTDRPTS